MEGYNQTEPRRTIFQRENFVTLVAAHFGFDSPDPKLFPDAHKSHVEAAQCAMGLACLSCPVQNRSSERSFIVRIWKVVAPSKGRKLFASAFANGFIQLRGKMAREIEKWMRLSVFFPHKQQRHEWRKQCNAGREFYALKINELYEPFALRAVPHLVVILAENNEPALLNPCRGIPVPSPPKA